MLRCARLLPALACLLAAPASAQPAASTSLDGVWTSAWLTTMERRKELKALTMTEAEARAFEANPPRIQEKDPIGQEESEFNERGATLARIRGAARTSWIFSPADGKIPWTAAAAAANKARGEGYETRFDHVEQRPPAERCMGGGVSGPPLSNGPDLNVHQIVQTPDHVLIRSEYLNNTRIVRIGAKHGPAGMRRWLGDAIGWWEGATLVVETVDFHPLQHRGPGDAPTSPQRKVTERFTRTSPTELHYAFKVEDPALYAQAWRGEMILRPERAIHEYACHEGNYAVANILVGGRKEQSEKPASMAAAATAP